jgi:hypothetical protein
MAHCSTRRGQEMVNATGDFLTKAAAPARASFGKA